MLTSVSNLDALHERGVFKGSHVKPAIRANDTTDCWGGIRHGRYAKHPGCAAALDLTLKDFTNG